jgi:hypothetical protein
MYSTIAFASSTRVRYRLRLSSSTCIRPQNDPATALPYGSPAGAGLGSSVATSCPSAVSRAAIAAPIPRLHW